jgi:hypothetical protein
MSSMILGLFFSSGASSELEADSRASVLLSGVYGGPHGAPSSDDGLEG